ncbi:MAG: hypothetical protein QM504_06660 [Pseudomonadota bacterium]
MSKLTIIHNILGAQLNVETRYLSNEPFVFVTNFWACVCENEFVHDTSQEMCDLCGSERDSCDDAKLESWIMQFDRKASVGFDGSDLSLGDVFRFPCQSLILNKPDSFDHINFELCQERFPHAYKQKLMCLMESGASESEAREFIDDEKLEIEFYYERNYGLMAVESEAVESVPIYSPYNKKRYLEATGEDENNIFSHGDCKYKGISVADAVTGYMGDVCSVYLYSNKAMQCISNDNEKSFLVGLDRHFNDGDGLFVKC